MNSLLNQLLHLHRMEYVAVDRNLLIIETSPGVQRLSDCPTEVTLGKPVCASFPELIGIEDILITVLDGQRSSFDLKGIGRFSEQGYPLYLNIYILKYQNSNNFGDYLIIFIEDVTEQMVVQQELVQRANEVSLVLEAWNLSNEYFNQVFQSLADALLITTRSGMIKIVNQATRRLFGYREEELIGKQMSSIIIEYDLLLDASQQYLLSPEIRRDVEVVGLTKNGTKIAISFSCSAIQTTIKDLQDFAYVGRQIA